VKRAFRFLLAVFFVVAGANHFVSSGFYQSVMPPYLPWHSELVAISGVAEILGGVGVLIPRTRKLAAWGLIALLIAVLPVHIQMVIHGFRSVPTWLLWLRLPLQFVLIAWVYSCCISARSATVIEKSFR
jgi:uncharacterized membrane protein